jgi:thioredoxin 1
VENLSKDNTFANAAIFRVNFDKDKEAVQFFKAQYQATLIVFKGKLETGRSTGESDPDKIRDLFKKGL